MISWVLDASVCAKWYLPPANETFVNESLSVFEGYSRSRVQLLVPDLFWAELGNIFWKAVRAKKMSPASAETALDSALRLGIPATPSASVAREALAIATAFDRTFYDAVYVALAKISGIPLLTADERLANRLAAYFPVRWLGSVEV